MRLKTQTAAPALPRLFRPQDPARLRSSTGLEPGPPLRCPCKTKPGACGLGFLFWWAIPISARTQNLTKGDGLGILFEVEVQHHTVLKDIDRVDEVVDDLPLVSRTVHISLPELLKPEQDLFPAQSWPLQFFFQDAGLEGVLTASSSSRRCLVVEVKMPCSMASSRLDSRFSVSRSCSFRTGRWVFSRP